MQNSNSCVQLNECCSYISKFRNNYQLKRRHQQYHNFQIYTIQSHHQYYNIVITKFFGTYCTTWHKSFILGDPSLLSLPSLPPCHLVIPLTCQCQCVVLTEQDIVITSKETILLYTRAYRNKEYTSHLTISFLNMKKIIFHLFYPLFS